MTYDLIIKAGRMVDPAQGIDATLDIAFSDGKVAKVAPAIGDGAMRTVDGTGLLVLPGLIDFHTHVYWGGTSLGVDAEEMAMRSGTTTFVDAGSAGAGNMAGFVKHVIEHSDPRILAFINVSFPGIFGFSKAVMVGENSDLRLLSARECVRVAREFRDTIVGVKARIGFNAGGASGIAPLDIAIEIADELDLPVMAHIDFPPPSRDEVLARLRPGDILTHCFRPFPNAPIDGKRKVRDTIRKAHERGVLFDIGHGYGGFAFEPGKAAMDQGIMPDILSSDVHVLSKDGPAYDILHIMNKFWAVGMSLTEVVRAVTETPAASLRRPELGSLAEGTIGDATLVRLETGTWEYHDVLGAMVTGNQRLALAGTIIGGKLWDKGPQPA
ncbi:MAG: amidohydrolase/deacetylase family metallohydrolase [Hyphomicrobiales bacterium]|nr:MAG: amidohydrolase/deacetylase family metallohydrolase [Hyphomicrobiales bacterium]